VLTAYGQHQAVADGGAWNLDGRYQLRSAITLRSEVTSSKDEALGFVAQRDNTVFVVFRGTQTNQDWLADFNFPQMSDPFIGQGAIATGFFHWYDLCKDEARQGVQDAVDAAADATALHVVVTGHSLGAALAVLASANLATVLAARGAGNVPRLSMYSFAGPRVGSVEFAAAFNRLVTDAWRVVNTEDLVTIVAFASAILAPLPVLVGTLVARLPGRAGQAVQGLVGLATGLNYEHVGQPVSFTVHDSTIEDNHKMELYLKEVRNGTVTRL
jgi:triacylglycerol lipase